ncbi:hypothetical protein H8K35_15040 [Undibacterium sp. LX40W]|uniref:Uncharacterized protein n=1 Tax=Undibacterium nitidum TaxID=2762298 RepID=A0A923HT44_9BURK|nr:MULTISPECIES: hypothetical protein [Undibacterium]MBC3882830.1 hypothetical protein [Undibacterium nitidum]MBC3892987.1 hypothetical protein [Undibacterium sp. LX40W]
MPNISDLLEFEFIPARLKDFAYSKYDVDTLSIRTFGEINNDYCLVLIAYNDKDKLLELFGNYKAVDESLNKNIFDKYREISGGAILLPEGLKVFVEKFSQEQALEILDSD